MAFRASRLVCWAIEVIAFTTSPISPLDWLSLATVPLVEWATSRPWPATFEASAAERAISLIEVDSSSALAATVWTLDETSSAAAATVVASADVRSELADIWREMEYNSSEALASPWAISAIADISFRLASSCRFATSAK